jgi:hypothetical protein
VIGAIVVDRQHLEKTRKANRKLAFRVVGFLGLADDVSAELAQATIESVKVHGIFKASKPVKAALADRMK